MDTEGRKRILDRIQKCLNLSASSNEHEAAAALRQAQKLMEMHAVSDAELSGAGYGNESVDVPIQAGRKVPVQLSRLITLIMKAFGVKGVTERRVASSDQAWRVRYWGLETRVPIACYAHDVVFKAMDKGWNTFLIYNPEYRGQRNARLSWQLGFLDAIMSKIEAIGFTDAEQIAVDLVQTAYYGKELSKNPPRRMGVDPDLKADGSAAGSKFNLHRPMGGATRRQLT